METLNKTIEILEDLSNIKPIYLNSNLQTDLGLDSLLMVTLLIELEEMLQVELDESDMNPFDLSTVEDVVKLVERYCKKND